MKNLISSIIFLFLTILPIQACSDTNHQAIYILNKNGSSIAIELSPIHPFLAEYDRILILSLQGGKITKQKLFPDTGGYSSSNLYKCGPTIYLVKGYFDEWIVDLEAGTIIEGQCKEADLEYVGVFKGGGSNPWQFYLPSEYKETKLEAKGG